MQIKMLSKTYNNMFIDKITYYVVTLQIETTIKEKRLRLE